jgi:hypothetical protein
MKTKVKSILVSGLISASMIFTSSCEKYPNNSGNTQYASVIEVSADGTTNVIEANVTSAFVTTGSLSETEIAALLKMKEEEKLARDIYSSMYQKWNSQIFSRISAAENNHLNAINLLIKNYGLADSLIGDAGIFSNIDIQDLYNQLVISASGSIDEAYRTGALVEEMDIKDLTESLLNVSNENVVLVFDNLLKGSRNHMRAFDRQLTFLGISYAPAYLDQADFDQIVNSAMEMGKQYKMKGQGNGKGAGNGTCDGSHHASGQMHKNHGN